MTVVDVRWTPRVNVLVIRCDCQVTFDHPANYAQAQCPACGFIQYVEPSLAESVDQPCAEFKVEGRAR